MFLGSATVQSYISDVLKLTSSSTLLPEEWVNLAIRSQQRAYQTIVRVLLAKGFLKTQVDLWDEGGTFEGDLAAFFAGVQGNALQLHEFSKEFLDTLDRRQELSEMKTLVIGGVAVLPAGYVGLPNVGQQDTSGDMFVWPDPADPRLGEVTRW